MASLPRENAGSASAAYYLDRYGVLPGEASHHQLLRMIEDHLNERPGTRAALLPVDGHEFAHILDELRRLGTDDLRARLVIAGWQLRPQGAENMRCQECMYYLVHRRWCDLPEMNLPARADWWCRFWQM